MIALEPRARAPRIFCCEQYVCSVHPREGVSTFAVAFYGTLLVSVNLMSCLGLDC